MDHNIFFYFLYIGTYMASGNFQMFLSGLGTEICQPECSQHGKCERGECVCDEDWLGEDCSGKDV